MAPGINRSTKLIKKRRKKNRILKNFVNYLNSNSYMYDPIVSSQIINCPPPTTETTCSETKKSVKRNKNLLKKIVEYLKSDSFMYAPLLSPPLPSDHDEATVRTSHEGRLSQFLSLYFFILFLKRQLYRQRRRQDLKVTRAKLF
ncbi:uncharacterized protein LOC124913339 [Impatiens glandulifera]|uniref:uncharacterized protein LOC124913339 n=1 Tax=Impatiens glandulifera TaxID=253017 RepID=UPI001FB1980E|nr:uncharacterized protein LOC124913339 [Impatiens glandulifera]